MLKAMGFAVLVSLAAGCATIDYVGETYRPTGQVDLFFSEDQVPREYKVIGQVRASGDEYVTASGLHQKLMAKARETGADAVIILEISRRQLLDQKDFEETVTESKDEKGVTIKKTGSVSNPSAEGNVIKALFIKYR
jgi:putative NIF3 family GTP cyclohydrolase 1 type 2